MDCWENACCWENCKWGKKVDDFLIFLSSSSWIYHHFLLELDTNKFVNADTFRYSDTGYSDTVYIYSKYIHNQDLIEEMMRLQ